MRGTAFYEIVIDQTFIAHLSDLLTQDFRKSHDSCRAEAPAREHDADEPHLCGKFRYDGFDEAARNISSENDARQDADKVAREQRLLDESEVVRLQRIWAGMDANVGQQLQHFAIYLLPAGRQNEFELRKVRALDRRTIQQLSLIHI